MIDNKLIPNEFVSIRQVWLCQINRCLEAMSNQAMKEDKAHGYPGVEGVIDSVRAFYYTLVDFGEAYVKSDVKKLYETWRTNKLKSLTPDEKLMIHDAEKKRFEIIIQVLNKYGMLFESQPSGYTNVIMESI